MNFTLLLTVFSLFCSAAHALLPLEHISEKQKIVVATKKIELENYPNAFNPSIFEVEDGYLMSFRHCPDLESRPWLAYIGVVLLDRSFEPISRPEILTTRPLYSKTISQSEDARIFSYRNRIFLVFNDGTEKVNPTYGDRRDMYIAELKYEKSRLSLSLPLKLIHTEKYNQQFWQKNWTPFEWNKTLLFSYMINPHEIIYPNLKSGECYRIYETEAPITWEFGTLRGSTPAMLVDGEYLAFFHSGILAHSDVSWGEECWHYFMGAYTFSASPPFGLTQITTLPIVGKDFYTKSNHLKRVIFPGGFVTSGSHIHVAYGKDDCEMWIATLDKEALKKALVPLKLGK